MRSLIPTFTLMALACAKPQTPTMPEDELDVVEEELAFTVGDRPVSATYTRPDTTGDVPVVLFIAGSGPTDRDWNSPLLPGENGSGALLAHALAERGIASLRYDKFGLDGFTGQLSWSDYADEQRAGLGLLLDRQDTAGLWIAGHSEGGLHALSLAAEGVSDVNGLVLMATPGRPLDDVLITQVAEVAGAEHAASLDMALTQFRSGRSDLHVNHPEVDALLTSLQHPQTRPFVDELLFWDPVVRVRSVDLPLLIVHGAKDIQVSGSKDADSLEAAARGAANDVTRVDLPWSDHLFKLEQRPLHELGPDAARSYNAPERQLDPMLPDAIAAWIYR